MSKCKECKFWTPPGARDDSHSGHCSNEHFVDNNTRFFQDDTQKEKEALEASLVYWDYEGYSCGFSVGPEFGCIYWEAK